MDFSVLVPVYKKEKPQNLYIALQSIINQSLKPSEILIVKNCLLTPELDQVIAKLENEHREIVKVLAFAKNRGLGLALKDGILECRYEFIARMDSDDISYPDRFRKQLDYLKNNPEIALIGSWISEFSKSPAEPDTLTKLPVTHEEIVQYAKRRNPLRHQTVVFRKSAVLASGNYRTFLWFEDYDLWIRIIKSGYKVANIPEVLVNVRADVNMFARRGGFAYWQQDMKFQCYLYKIDYISFWIFLSNCIIRTAMRILPNGVRTYCYRAFLRKRI